jgi:predicted membrane protein
VNMRRLILGLAAVLLGVVLLMDSTNMLDFGGFLRDWWPALLVIAGVWLLFSNRRVAVATDSSDGVFGDMEVRVTSQGFRGGAVDTVFGDVRVDLSQGGPAEGEQRLRVNGVFGDVRIVVPKNLALAVAASTMFGKLDVCGRVRDGFGGNLKFVSDQFSVSPKRLDVHVSGVFGDVSVVEA